jgi:HSP20 family protein
MFGKKNKDNKRERALERRRESDFSPLERFQRRMNSLFDDFFSDWGSDISTSDTLASREFTPQIDIREDDKKVYIDAELPGLDKGDIEIEIKNNILTISGEKKHEKEEKDKEYHRVERSYGYFERSVRIDSDVEEDKIKASYKNGVLSIDIPKKEGSESKKRKISIE